MKIASPSDFAGTSTRGTSVPISRKSFGALSSTSAGGVNAAAASASSPKEALRPEPPWRTSPRSTVISLASTPQAVAAAATSIARAVAPA